MKSNIHRYILALFLAVNCSCSKYLDIIPDNIATIEHAFAMRETAERYLFTCYAYMPFQSSIANTPGFSAGDEFWFHNDYQPQGWNIARGFQGVVSPYLNYWQGAAGGKDLYEGLRACNVFLENIMNVPDMADYEKRRWASEALFLKAYYHFYLVRMYGPIPIKRENLPVDADDELVKVKREPVDDVFTYIVELLEEAEDGLPDEIASEISELGRITKPISLSLKAEVLLTWASPLFNGNTDYANFKDKDGTLLFNQTYNPELWERALAASKEAVALCESLGYKLYEYNQSSLLHNVSDEIYTQMSIRNSVTERFNKEIIWGNTNSTSSAIQVQATPRGLDPGKLDNGGVAGNLAVPIKIAELFYTKNGVPISEDKDWNYNNRFGIRKATATDRYYIEEGYTTSALHFDREPRFYASLGFDGGKWYGQNRFNDEDTWTVYAKKGQAASTIVQHSHNATGYWPKKLVNYQNSIETGNTYTVENYPWPVMRLANLYLMLAEAENEVNGAGEAVYKYLDLIRTRSGLPGVVESWATHSKLPDKPTTQAGLREIIHQERLIELALEGQRFWDLRRWKKAVQELNKPITGWDLAQRTAEGYFRQKTLFTQTFNLRDYFWPVSEAELLANKNTVQNPGW